MIKDKTDSLLKKPARKFLFDVNDFDEKDEAEEDALPEEPPPPPPPPTFSEAELEAARRDGLARGRAEASAEAEASRERRVADLLDVISREFSTLFAAEDMRNAQYEAESVRLTLAVLKRLFPDMNRKYGLAEIKSIVAEVLETQREQPVIKVEVQPDYVETIRDHIERVVKQGNMSGDCQVLGNQQLGDGDVRMSWADGGAFRESAETAEDIARHMQVILADRPRLRDNNHRTETRIISAPAPQESAEPINAESEDPVDDFAAPDDDAAPQGE